jgi:DNA helicase II / ATP-dependent DNA helicase PcrA
MTSRFLPTDEQRAASRHVRQFALVEACAGAGKTATIAERFGHTVFGEGTGRAGVLVCAFTREATNELRDRIERRYGPAALRWPHACWTIDELVRHLFEVLARNGLIGSELETVALSTVLDTWQGYEGDVYVSSERQPKRFQTATLGTFRRKGPTVQLRQRTPKKPCYDVKSKRNLLLNGIWTHQDIRDFVVSCLREDRCRLLLSEYVAARWHEVIVDECFDGNDEDTEVWSLLAAHTQRLTLFGDHWQAIYEFRRSDASAVRAWATSQMAPQREPLRLTESHRHSPAMALLCEQARNGSPIALPTWLEGTHPEVDIALGRWWSDLRRSGIRPDQLGSLRSCTHALLEIAYQQVVFGQSTFRGDARAAILIRMVSGDDSLSVFPELSGCLAACSDILDFLKLCQERFEAAGIDTKDFTASYNGSRRGRRGERWGADVDHRLEFARSNPSLSSRRGITIHSAKGREWEHVGVVPNGSLKDRLKEGLSVDDEEDRIVFVGISRARQGVYLLE